MGKFCNFLQMLSVCNVKVMPIIPFCRIPFYVGDGHSPAADAEHKLPGAVNEGVVAFRGGYRARGDDATGRLPGITYTRCVTNEEVQQLINDAIGPHDDLLSYHHEEMQTEVVRPRHQILGRCKKKNIPENTLYNDAGKEGSGEKRWEDVIEWTNLKPSKAMRRIERAGHLWCPYSLPGVIRW